MASIQRRLMFAGCALVCIAVACGRTDEMESSVMSATDLSVNASKQASLSASSFMDSIDRHGVAKMVIPFVHPACVLSLLAEKFIDLTADSSCAVTYTFGLWMEHVLGCNRLHRIRPIASDVLPSVSISW